MWILGTVVAFALGGCVEKVSPRARQELDASTSAYQAGDYDAAIRHADAVLDEAPSGETAWEALYLRGMAQYRQGAFEAARSALQRVVDETGQDVLIVKASDALGEIAYRQDDLAAAAQYFKTAIDSGEPKEPPLDHAHYRLGCIHQRSGRWADADLHFQRVAYGFPDSELTELAGQRSGARHWTIQAGAFTERSNAVAGTRLFPIAGPKPFVEPVIRDGDQHFLLMVGRWTTYEPAEAALPSVRQIKPDAFLTVVR
jgi:TolA-binding protein